MQLIEVAGSKQGTRNEPQPEIPVLFFSSLIFFFFFLMVCARGHWYCLSLSLALSLPHLLVMSKITIHKRLNDVHTQKNIDRATYRIQQHKHNVQMHSVTPVSFTICCTEKIELHIETEYITRWIIERLNGLHWVLNYLTARLQIAQYLNKWLHAAVRAIHKLQVYSLVYDRRVLEPERLPDTLCHKI